MNRNQFVIVLVAARLTLLVPTVASAAPADRNVAVIAVPGGGQPNCAKIDAEGTIHLVFQSAEGPQYANSTDQGKTFSRPIPIVDRQSRKPGLEFSAWDMAVGPEGRVHVVMGTNAWKLKLPKEEWGCFYARLDPGLKTFTPVANINHKPSEGFSIASDERGNVTACWLSDKLYANISHDHGATFGPTVEIDPTFNPCNCCTTSVTYGADGKLAVLYREETNNDRDMFLVLWDQGQNEVSRTRVSTTLWNIDACPMSYYTITAVPDGYVAVWPTDGQIYFARLNANGGLLSPVEIKTPGMTGMRTGMLTLSGADGKTLVAWNYEKQLHWQLYDAAGRAAGRPGSATSAGKGAAGVVGKDGQFVLFR